MSSLTHAEAQTRAALLSVTAYEVALDLTGDDRYFGSVTTVRFACTGADDARTFVDVAPESLARVVLNGRELDLAEHFDPAARRVVLTGLAPENELLVEATMAYSHDGEGLHRHVDPADGNVYLYAMSFLDAAPRWFACFDQPDLKAPLRLDVACPEDWTVAGNGPATRVSPGRWRLDPTAPLATYFTTVVAGPYHSVRSEHDGIPLVLHVRRSLAEHLDRDADELFAVTRSCLDELHRLFGVRYPWGEYHQAFVPDFNAGAMENPGCVTLRDQLIFRSAATEAERADRAVTITHEMSHMWFGDLVTMKWWDDLWLNESFAEYCGQAAIGDHSWAAFGIERKSWGYRADRLPSTHPVAGNGAPDAESALTSFDGISYAKGASALRQLAAHLGEERFLAGLRTYISRHEHGNAALADLLTAWREAGADDIDDWAAAWLRTTGMDELRVEGRDLVRTASGDVPRPHTISVARIGLDGTTTGAAQVTATSARTPFTLDDVPGDAPGLLLPDAFDETWAKVALDDTAWTAMPTVLATLADKRSRVVVWNALQNAVADSDVAPLLATDIVAGAMPPEYDDAIVTVVGRWVLRTASAYLTATAGRQALDHIAEAMLTVANEAAAPGSGRQLAAARIVIRAAADTARLQRWLTGTDTPEGLRVDADLRWTIMRRLAASGVVSAADIAAEAARDDTSQGAVNAAGCRAALPTEAAKDTAWTALMSDAGHGNYELYAIAENFWQPGQDELTADYVPRYFTELPAWSGFRSGMLADRLAFLAYPWTAVYQETLDAADRALSDGAFRAGLRKAVVDGTDDLRRALTSMQRFGE